MSDDTILYAGMLCFALILLAFALTVWEFKKMKPREAPRPAAPEAKGAARARAPGA